MAAIQTPPPVLRLVAIVSRYDEALEWARERIEREWGPIALASSPYAFHDTDYYARQMGTELKKQFVASAQLMDPGRLAELKCRTNAWEAEYTAAAGHPEPRPLNLDPGYLAEAKLVLASTKNHAHRVYLRDGIYAEVTLVYSRSAGWTPQPWTYPDYRRQDFQQFFTHCREYLREQLRRQGAAEGVD